MSLRLQTLCRIAEDPESVTSIRPQVEVDPREVGVAPADVDGILDAMRRLYAGGAHPAISLCIRRRGRVLLDRTIGHVSGVLPDDPPDAEAIEANYDTPFCLASASKPVTAILMHLMDDRGLLHVDDPVCEYLPEFGRYGKETITIRHLLTHRAGVPNPPPESMNIDLLAEPERIVDLLCHQVPSWRPGTRMGYHAVTTGFLFAEIVQRVTGRDIRTWLREEIADPLGCRFLGFGVDEADLPLVARSAFTGLPPVPPISWLFERALGKDLLEVIEFLNDPRFLTSIFPSANVIANADELCRFYELLRLGGQFEGQRLLKRRTIQRAVAEQSWMEPDFTLLLPFRYSMGFMLGGEYMSLYGLNAHQAFGHIGLTNVLGWADPERDLSVALLCSGRPVLYPELLTLVEMIFRIAAACPRDGSGIGADQDRRLRLAERMA